MRIVEFDSHVVSSIPFLNAGRRSGEFREERIPVQRARVDSLPDALEAIVVTGDLQGRERFQDGEGGPPRLLGEVLPDRLVREILPEFGVTDPERVAVLLCGDFYTLPALDRRGGSGDVTAVWHAFGQAFRWVAGVVGNHDTFGEQPVDPPRLPANAHLLNGDVATCDDLCIGGLGGIIGNPERLHRHDERDYLAHYELLLDSDVGVIVSHDGPRGPLEGQRGSSPVRNLVANRRPCLIVRGHAHWSNPFGEFPNGAQVLNVDSRVVVLSG